MNVSIIMNNTKLQYYDKIDVPEGIDINKTFQSKECNVCHYWYFLNKGFKFQTNFCNRWGYLLMMSIHLSDIAILNIKDADFCCIISRICKIEDINLM